MPKLSQRQRNMKKKQKSTPNEKKTATNEKKTPVPGDDWTQNINCWVRLLNNTFFH